MLAEALKVWLGKKVDSPSSAAGVWADEGSAGVSLAGLGGFALAKDLKRLEDSRFGGAVLVAAAAVVLLEDVAACGAGTGVSGFSCFTGGGAVDLEGLGAEAVAGTTGGGRRAVLRCWGVSGWVACIDEDRRVTRLDIGILDCAVLLPHLQRVFGSKLNSDFAIALGEGLQILGMVSIRNPTGQTGLHTLIGPGSRL